jgi:hypothetical protein
MPTILRKEVYEETFKVAKEVFARPDALKQFSMTKKQGSLLYRYLSYRNKGLLSQKEDAARKIWKGIESDTLNRWTGAGSDGKGFQGLYLSGEVVNEHKPFPELEHYQEDAKKEEKKKFEYFRYTNSGSDEGEKFIAPVSGLRSMFLFYTSKDLNGIDFSLKIEGKYHPLLTEIVERVKKIDPPVFGLGTEESLSSELYVSSDDASFTRAIGNALFEVDKTVDFFQATSVRDLMSHNIILRAEDGKPIDYLEALVRATLLVDDKDQCGVQVYTADDYDYTNDMMEEWVKKNYL